MYRFMSLKKIYISQTNLSGLPSEVRYSGTCTLCNRTSVVLTPFAGKFGDYKVHSTWLNPDRSTVVIKRKKYKIRSLSSPLQRVKYYPTSQQRARITILDTKGSFQENSKVGTQEELDLQKAFLTSSASSPVFSGSNLANIGITLMLPPNTCKKTFSQNSLDFLSVRKLRELSKNQNSGLLSYMASDLIFRGLNAAREPAQNEVPPHHTSKNQAQMFSEEQKLDNGELKKENVSRGRPKKSPYQTKSYQTNVKSIPKKTKRAKIDLLDEHLMSKRVVLSKLKRIIHRTSYIDVCVNSGRYDYAMYYAKVGLKYYADIPDCNMLVEPLICFAVREENMDEIKNLFSLARSEGVKMSSNAYLICFELLGRQEPSKKNLEVIRNLLKNLKEDGNTVDYLISKCQGRNVLIQRILQAVKHVEPDFNSSGMSLSTYHLDVLASLNDTSKSKSDQYHSPVSGLLSEDSVSKLVDEQIDLHSKTFVKIRNIACDLSNSEIGKYLQQQEQVEIVWREAIAAAFQSDFNALVDNKANFHLSNYLRCLPTEVFVDIIIQEVHSRINDSDKQSIGLIHAQRDVGRRVKDLYDKSILERYGILQKAREAHVAYCKWYVEPEKYPQGPSKPRDIWESIVSRMNFDDTYSTNVLRDWTSHSLEVIGKFLYNILLKDVKINENIGVQDAEVHMVPAVYIVFRKTTKGYQKQLKMHPAVHRVFHTKMQPYLSMSAVELPMVCPPRPWVSIKSGVYPLSSPKLQRSPESQVGEVVMAENIESVPTRHLYPCLDSLNQLGSVPWKINIPVLNVVTDVFKSGGSDVLSIPQPPALAFLEPPMPENVSLFERVKITKERARIRQNNAEMYSLWCDTLYKLCIAHEFRDRIFWLPHNMDFRGRVYPICPHLQHMSNDMARSLMIFAKGEKLGPDGLNWLKLHAINLTGQMSKNSLSSRLAYADEVMPKILDSAHKPLTGDKWWMKSEDPWQTLAVCMEVATAIASGDPENFVSHFPVHQDGSCNGLQHYAALGRDSLGAKSVNLVDTEKPSDVYLCVADSVEQQRIKDADEGNELARSLEGFISRKVVKQTVMTTVYGVTQYGAKLQIQGRLKDLNYPQEKVNPAAAYIAKLVFQSLGEMFTSSRNTQDWLTQCATGIVKSKISAVKWVTPLGLPVIQPYFKGLNKKSFLLKVPEHLWENMSASRMPSVQKHRNAFSPNFIHSLDSCHMMLTGLHCEQSNVTYVSVHDCYWVHAKNVNAMSKICREQFVALHSEPILENLSKFLIESFCVSNSSEVCPITAVDDRRLHRIFSAIPPKGDFDLCEVLKSKYFFS